MLNRHLLCAPKSLATQWLRREVVVGDVSVPKSKHKHDAQASESAIHLLARRACISNPDSTSRSPIHAWVNCVLCLFAFLIGDKGLLADEPARANTGLLALYDFASASGPIVKDRSGVGEPLDLQISDQKAVRRSAGSLEVLRSTLIQSEGPARKIIDAVRRTNQFTIEAWIKPRSTKEDGPARIVTISKNPSERNFTLGQEFDAYDVRFRATRTTTNGMPSTPTRRRSLSTKLTHAVYTRDASGRTQIYLDGKPTASGRASGAASNWNTSYRLGLSNEFSGDRTWTGTFYLVAIYSRALSGEEITDNFAAGAGAQAAELIARSKAQQSANLFTNSVAPLFANHCVECHDPATKQGGLDLSRKVAALAGGENGKSFVPGKSADSLLWQMVETDDMPKKRAPLSASDKKKLKQWIDSGAAWPIDTIDPAVYAPGGGSDQVWVQRLTVSEYAATVKASVGVDISKEATEILPRDLRADGFSNTAYNLGVDLKHIEAYSRLAETIVSRMDVLEFPGRFPRSRRLIDKDMRSLISSMGKWILRGPLEGHEVDTYRGISTTVASTGGDFKEAVSFIIEAMLQSPRFIYRVEHQRGGGSAWPVSQFELASRLSYIVWGSSPDKELFEAADKNQLDREKAAKQVRRMLADPRAMNRSLDFVTDWLNLNRLSSLKPDAKRFPNWSPELAQDMRTETREFFREIVWNQKRPLANLLNAQVTFATARLAKHYGLPPVQDKNGVVKFNVADIPARGGLLTQGSIMTIGGDNASMVSRGLFVFHELLRGVVQAPPPCVDTTPVPTKSGLTQRDIASARIANRNCGGCHSKFEPLAFGLEKFDGVGQYADKDRYGNTLREDGKILFPGSEKPITYKTSAELMDVLANSERVRESLTWKVTQFSLGRPLSASDATHVASIHKRSQQAGGTYQDLIEAIITSDLVQLGKTERELR